MADEERGALGSKIRSKIQESIEQAERERKKEMFRQRVGLARKGVGSMRSQKLGQSVESFLTYLRILEEYKGVEENGLQPAMFDPKEDAHELLLIAGIYWDLTKMYDRTKSNAKVDEFRVYLKKYVQFSKGMQFETLCMETLRKYIWNDKPIHKKEFEAAYKQLGGTKCFIASELLLEIDPMTLPRLQTYRDQKLRRSRLGRRFILSYYEYGPLLARILKNSPQLLRRGLARLLDGLALILSKLRSS